LGDTPIRHRRMALWTPRLLNDLCREHSILKVIIGDMSLINSNYPQMTIPTRIFLWYNRGRYLEKEVK